MKPMPDQMLERLRQVAHIKAAGQFRNHSCHWPGCSVHVPPAKWGCRRHWYALPAPVRARIWRAYQIGQERSGRPSAEYVAAAREAQDWIRDHGKIGWKDA